MPGAAESEDAGVEHMVVWGTTLPPSPTFVLASPAPATSAGFQRAAPLVRSPMPSRTKKAGYRSSGCDFHAFDHFFKIRSQYPTSAAWPCVKTPATIFAKFRAALRKAKQACFSFDFRSYLVTFPHHSAATSANIGQSSLILFIAISAYCAILRV